MSERLSDYDYDLPEELIAQTPLEDRAASRLLRVRRCDGALFDHSFRDSIQLLEPGDLLVLNDTRVSALRLRGAKESGGLAQLLLLREGVAPGEFVALCKPAKTLRVGSKLSFSEGLKGEIVEILPEGCRLVRLSPLQDLSGRLHEIGRTPLPPYIHTRASDPERYQTVYGKTPGSAASPTAGLHFTIELLDALRAKGVSTAHVTLDVGMDTFRPVTSEALDGHKMHGESCYLPEATAEAIASCKGRIVAVGTTAARALESFASGRRRVAPGSMSTSIFIRPQYDFQIVDGMFTNFHLPRTTTLAMVAALVGLETMQRAYAHAVRRRYRFLSFGDSMLIL